MNKLILLIVMALTGIQSTVLAQKSAAFLPEKPGKWKFDYNIAVRNNDEIKFKDNITTLAEWFHQNLPLLTHPKGFNLWAYAAGMWDDHYQISDSNYGLRAELNFNFNSLPVMAKYGQQNFRRPVITVFKLTIHRAH
jgi:hypothetical protein